MYVKSFAECTKRSILQYFRPSFRSLFCLFLSGGLRQVYGYHVVYRYMMQGLMVPESLIVVSILIASDCLFVLVKQISPTKARYLGL